MTIRQVHPVLTVPEPQSQKSSGGLQKAGNHSFSDLLNQVRDMSCQPGTTQDPLPVKGSEKALADQVAIQMSNHLLRALLTEDQEPSDLRYLGLLDRLTLPSSISSKNDPPYQNPDMGSYQNSLQSLIEEAATFHGIDSDLIRSVIKVESDFNPGCTSPKGAMGLMQLMPNTARELGVTNPYDPAENVKAGTRYLRTLMDRYQGDLPSALAAYNWGMGNLEKRPDRIPPETTQYVEKVLLHYRQAKV